ncbi:uncharacterized protein A4U43_C08F14630 [Asparagus officinalis]|nr:uncharacterized protein A4U43_C08F14630 [Asparagus officinalis]
MPPPCLLRAPTLRPDASERSVNSSADQAPTLRNQPSASLNPARRCAKASIAGELRLRAMSPCRTPPVSSLTHTPLRFVPRAQHCPLLARLLCPRQRTTVENGSSKQLTPALCRSLRPIRRIRRRLNHLSPSPQLSPLSPVTAIRNP